MADPNRQSVRLTNLAGKNIGDDPSLHIVPNIFVDLAASYVRSGESYERRKVRGSLTGTSTDAVEFDQAVFDSVDLSKTKWHKLGTRDVRFEKCDLANARWINARLEASYFSKCRCTGLQLLDANCSDTTFSGCNFSLSAFHGSKFRNCRWENCNLREANFEGVELIGAVFRKCDLRAARFPNARLETVDWRGSHLAGVQIEPAKLRGSRIDPSQLLELAELFELTVESLDDSGESLDHESTRQI